MTATCPEPPHSPDPHRPGGPPLRTSRWARAWLLVGKTGPPLATRTLPRQEDASPDERARARHPSPAEQAHHYQGLTPSVPPKATQRPSWTPQVPKPEMRTLGRAFGGPQRTTPTSLFAAVRENSPTTCLHGPMTRPSDTLFAAMFDLRSPARPDAHDSAGATSGVPSGGRRARRYSQQGRSPPSSTCRRNAAESRHHHLAGRWRQDPPCGRWAGHSTEVAELHYVCRTSPGFEDDYALITTYERSKAGTDSSGERHQHTHPVWGGTIPTTGVKSAVKREDRYSRLRSTAARRPLSPRRHLAMRSLWG